MAIDPVEWRAAAEAKILGDPILFTKFNPAQIRAIHSLDDKDGVVIVISMGNGTGKTFVTFGGIVGAILFGTQNKEFSADVYRKWPHTKSMRIVSTTKAVEDNQPIQKAMHSLWPKGRWTQTRGAGKQYWSQGTTDTGWDWDVMNYNQDVQEFAAATKGLIVCSEPPPEHLFGEMVSRLRAGGILIIEMTPLTYAGYLKDLVDDGALRDAKGKIVGKVVQVHGDIHENCRDCSGGQLGHADIERTIALWPAEEREARRTGEFLSLSGRIFGNFNRDVHVSKSELVPPEGEDVSYFMVVDPAIGKPLAVIWAWADRAGCVNVYDEWPDFDFEGAKDSNLTVADYAKMFLAREKGRVFEARILDRHFGNARRSMGGLTLKQELSEAGLDFVDSYSLDQSPEVETGILKVREYLSYNTEKPLDSLNRPKLVISPKCKNLIKSVQRWARNPTTGKPLDDYKDFCDCLRYLLMHDPRYEPPRIWQEVKLPAYGVCLKS